jgi:hypothetical protein
MVTYANMDNGNKLGSKLKLMIPSRIAGENPEPGETSLFVTGSDGQVSSSFFDPSARWVDTIALQTYRKSAPVGWRRTEMCRDRNASSVCFLDGPMSAVGRATLPAEEPVAPRIRAMRLGDSHVTA